VLSNLAVTYGKLGRHQDALALREKVLALSRRVLPVDEPLIGEFARSVLFVFDVCRFHSMQREPCAISPVLLLNSGATMMPSRFS
jgi:hypothetical protein